MKFEIHSRFFDSSLEVKVVPEDGQELRFIGITATPEQWAVYESHASQAGLSLEEWIQSNLAKVLAS